MRVAVVGATGRIGSLTCTVLERDGHEVVRIGRTFGVDAFSREGLDGALDGVGAVIDCTNVATTDEAQAVDFFTTMTRNLLDAETAAGVGHHVLLTIAGIGRIKGNAHYAGKRAQEAAVESGSVPYSIVPATQFHDFAAMIASWTENDGVAVVPPLLIQPIAPGDVAEVLAEVAVGEPVGRHAEIAGPDPQDLVDMARRTYLARGKTIILRPTWDNGIFDESMAGSIMIPPNPQLAPTTFDAWLEAEARNSGPA